MSKLQRVLLAGIMISGVIFLATSCSEDSPQFNSEKITITVSDNEWVWSEPNPEVEGEGYFIVRKTLPQLSKYIFDNGVISVFLVLDDGVMTGLPSLTTSGYGTEDRNYYTQYIGYELKPGEISFFIELSDLAEGNPSDMNFEVRMVW
mgnify:CR=1 FL=1